MTNESTRNDSVIPIGSRYNNIIMAIIVTIFSTVCHWNLTACTTGNTRFHTFICVLPLHGSLSVH